MKNCNGRKIKKKLLISDRNWNSEFNSQMETEEFNTLFHIKLVLKENEIQINR